MLCILFCRHCYAGVDIGRHGKILKSLPSSHCLLTGFGSSPLSSVGIAPLYEVHVGRSVCVSTHDPSGYVVGNVGE